jgi:hypothetical protein
MKTKTDTNDSNDSACKVWALTHWNLLVVITVSVVIFFATPPLTGILGCLIVTTTNDCDFRTDFLYGLVVNIIIIVLGLLIYGGAAFTARFCLIDLTPNVENP